MTGVSYKENAYDNAIHQVRSIAGGSAVVRNAIFTDWLQTGLDDSSRRRRRQLI